MKHWEKKKKNSNPSGFGHKFVLKKEMFMIDVREKDILCFYLQECHMQL